MDSNSVKKRLQELIENSPTFIDLPEEEREGRKQAMLSADEISMQRFIDVFEDELRQIEKMNQALQEDAEEIEKLITEAKQLEKEADREIRKSVEAAERVKDDLRAEELLKKLDEITIDSKSQ